MTEFICLLLMKSITFFPVSSGLPQSGPDLEPLCCTGLLILAKSCPLENPQGGYLHFKEC